MSEKKSGVPAISIKPGLLKKQLTAPNLKKLKDAKEAKEVKEAREAKESKEVKDTLEVPVVPKSHNRQESPTNSSPVAFSSSTSSSSSGNVKVVCRVRPMNQKELALTGGICVDFVDQKTIAMKGSQYMDPGQHKFTFDRVFDMNSNQEEVYNFTARPVVQSVLEGFNGTIFAYGQTSSGKTHTMLGPDIDSGMQQGIIPRMVTTVFEYINSTPDYMEFTVKVALVEIYLEKIRDLIDPEKYNLKIREDRARGIYIEDVSEVYVSQESEVYEIMKVGHANRAISATNMNEGSSRSHSIFMMSIHQNNLHDLSAKTGKLYLVDLAGSEKVAKTGAAGQVLEEAKNINKSLSALGNVINALTDSKGHQHIPYRDSKLTRILQESLGGNSKTTLIITCSPSAFNEMETLSTLRFGYRAKSIKNRPKINREFTVPELQLMLEKAEETIENQKLRIKALEGILKENKIHVPKVLEVNFEKPEVEDESPKTRSTARSDATFESKREEEISKKEKLMERNLRAVDRNEVEAKFVYLENELNFERNNVNMQTQKLDILREEFELVNAKVMTSEKENEALIHKLASLTLKLQEEEENSMDKDLKLEVLQSLKDALLAENEELKTSNKYLVQCIEEQNSVLEGGDRTISSDGSYKKNDYSRSGKPEDRQKNKGRDNDYDEQSQLEVFGRNIARRLGDEFRVDNEELLTNLVFQCLENVRLPTEKVTVESKDNEAEQDIDEAVRVVQDELSHEKKMRKKIEEEYKILAESYDSVVKTQIVDFDQVRKKIQNETMISEKAKYEREKDTIIHDLQNRVDKVVELEMLLDVEREKNLALESSMSDEEKILRKKIQTIESNLEQVTNMYHQQASKISLLTLDNQVNERKLQRKTDRVYSLEKQLADTKESMSNLKNTIEALKTLMSVSSAANMPVNQILSENWESVEGLQQYKDTIMQEIIPDFTRPPSFLDEEPVVKKANASPITSKIVKHIRGGTKKGFLGNQKAWGFNDHNNKESNSPDTINVSQISNYARKEKRIGSMLEVNEQNDN